MPVPLPIRLAARRSQVHGTGLYTGSAIAGRRKLGELTGVLIPVAKALREQRQRACIHMVELGDGIALDCTAGNLFRHLNHSCTANCYLRVVGHTVEIYSRRAISSGQELTVDYRATQHPGGMVCRCGSANCRGIL